MPKSEKLLSHFGLKKHLILGNYELTKIKTSRKILKRHGHYTYDIRLIFTPLKNINYNDLYRKLLGLIKSPKIINSSNIIKENRTYKCHIDNPDDVFEDYNLNIIFNLYGHARRVNKNIVRVCRIT